MSHHWKDEVRPTRYTLISCQIHHFLLPFFLTSSSTSVFFFPFFFKKRAASTQTVALRHENAKCLDQNRHHTGCSGRRGFTKKVSQTTRKLGKGPSPVLTKRTPGDIVLCGSDASPSVNTVNCSKRKEKLIFIFVIFGKLSPSSGAAASILSFYRTKVVLEHDTISSSQ